MDGAVGKLGSVCLAAALAAFCGSATAAGTSSTTLPDAPAFAADALAGRLNPETFDFAAAGYWQLPQQERALWQTAVFQGVKFGQPVPDGCAPEAQRSFVTGIRVMLVSQSADAAEWQAAHQALRERLTKLDTRLANVTASKPGADPVVQELMARYARDQDIRSIFTEPQWLEGMPPLAAKNWLTFIATRMSAIDCDNTAWLRAQLATVRWFSIPKYGADADSAAWHLVQI